LTKLIRRILKSILDWINHEENPSFMVYCGRNIPSTDTYQAGYVTDTMLSVFLNRQPFFDDYTIWYSKGSWNGIVEDSVVFEIFDQPLDKVKLFALQYKLTFAQEAVYIKISDTKTELV